MAFQKLPGLPVILLIFATCVGADPDPGADPAGCCSKPTTFLKGGHPMQYTFSHGKLETKIRILSRSFILVLNEKPSRSLAATDQQVEDSRNTRENSKF